MPDATRRTRGRPSLTLIELMFVVAMICVVSAIAIPFMARSLQTSSRAAREAAAGADAQAKALEAAARRQEPEDAPSPDSLPDFKSQDIAMRLSASHHAYGMEVYTRFESAFEGRLVVAGSGRPGAQVRLDIPFPVGTTEARDVSLRLAGPDGGIEPAGVVYDRRGIHWTGAPPAGGEAAFEARYVARGRDRFVWPLVPARRTGVLRMALDVSRVPEPVLPDHALQPTSIDGSRLSWDVGNLVSDRWIIVELPVSASPRSEVFSLFFVQATVLVCRGDLGRWPSLALAAATSLPLLAMHASRIVDRRFALTRALPMALYTLALAVDVACGGRWRDYGLMAGLFAAVAFLTATLPPVPPIRRILAQVS